MAHCKDMAGNNDFGLLFASAEDKDAAKRRCLELIEKELQRQSVESDELRPDLDWVGRQQGSDDSDTTETDGTVGPDSDSSELIKAERENAVYEKIFQFTLEDDKDHAQRCPIQGMKRPAYLVHLSEKAKYEKSEGLACWLNADNIDEAIMERLQMCHPEKNIICTQNSVVQRERQIAIAAEVSPVKYLAARFSEAITEKQRLQKALFDFNIIEVADHCMSLSVCYAGSYLTNPKVIAPLRKQDPCCGLYDVMRAANTVLVDFFKELVRELGDNVKTVFTPVFKQLYEAVCKLSLHLPDDIADCCGLIDFIAHISSLASVLMKSDYWLPPAQVQLQFVLPVAFRSPISGITYENSSLIGRLLGLTCVLRPSQQSEFFSEPSQQRLAEIEATTVSLRQQFNLLTDSLKRIFHNFLRSPDTKADALKWIVHCMRDNKGRKQLIGSMHNLSHFYASDGFFLNLCPVLLKLCEPFTHLSNSSKLASLNPSYCSQQVRQHQYGTTVFIYGMKEETKLNAQLPDGLSATEDDYNFITQMFFITHRCLQIGLSQVCSHYQELMQNLAKLQKEYSAAMAAGVVGVSRIQERFEAEMTRHLSYKAQLLNPPLIEMAFQFYVATARWLTQLAIGVDIGMDGNVEMESLKTPSTGLCHVPEFVAENLVQFIIFVRQYSETTLELMGDHLPYLLTFITVFMGNPDFVRNPHLRATMAEMLYLLMPQINEADKVSLRAAPMDIQRVRLFENHSFAHLHLIRALLHVFIDIEFTGHHNEFGQKLSYRHPMYSALKYMWKLKPFQRCVIALADECVEQAGTSTTSVFLRFINMMVNDATFMLDQVFEYLAKVKEGQIASDSGEWVDLPQEERQEREENFASDEGIATGNNILSLKVLNTLSFLTKKIHGPFILPSMVDRVVAMLNYFLVHLVGPKMAAIKVKNFEKYHFKPEQLVESIINIYVHLSNEEEFCAAIPRDGRSYSRTLFPQARRVMLKLCKPELAYQLSQLNEKVKYFDIQRQQREAIETDAPCEFLDPITDEIMTNPVKLPSSGIAVDRATIERHLLSDQTDPFNRIPLTIEEVIPDDELKEKISEWRQQNSNTDDSS